MSDNHTIIILALNNHEITISNINYLRYFNKGCKILLFDNGSNPTFKAFAKQKKIDYIREDKNIYVNPAWNKIFDLVKTKYITLLNNDCYIISKNYFNDVLNHMNKNNIILSSCKTFNVQNLNKLKLKMYEYYYNFNFQNKLKYTSSARRQGWIMTINLDVYRTLNYKIPEDFKIWYGDDWIWSQVAQSNLNYIVYKNRYAIHQKNQTITNKKLMSIVEEDKNNFKNNNRWLVKDIHIRSRIFNKYV